MPTAIEFNNISKQYRLGLVSTKTLSHDLNRWWQTAILHKEDPYLKVGSTNDRSKAADSEYVWALKDIDFKVEQGDVVGIIGKNGAGKSTLLKLLSRVTGPTTGTIKAKGRIGSLLEVGTGFHPEMTGRENIYMNGAILGMTKAEITRKLDEIVDFSGCERYIDTPVKRYSSGMTVRLGFAVAAHLDPEILVVDEVLAVGDAEFQKKAIGKMQDVSRGEGRTVLFVSHNMTSIRQLCARGILLKNGTVAFDGSAKEAIDVYINDNSYAKEKQYEIKDAIVSQDHAVKINKITFNGTTSTTTLIEKNQKFLDITVEGVALEPLIADLSFTVRNTDEVALASYSEGHFTGVCESIPEGHFTIKRRIKLPKFLFSGTCVVDLNMHRPGVVSYFSAPRGVTMKILGSMDEEGRALDLRYNGIVGFESIQVDE